MTVTWIHYWTQSSISLLSSQAIIQYIRQSYHNDITTYYNLDHFFRNSFSGAHHLILIIQTMITSLFSVDWSIFIATIFQHIIVQYSYNSNHNIIDIFVIWSISFATIFPARLPYRNRAAFLLGSLDQLHLRRLLPLPQ